MSIYGCFRKSSILIGFSIIDHPIWGTTIFGNIHIEIYLKGGSLHPLKSLNILKHNVQTIIKMIFPFSIGVDCFFFSFQRKKSPRNPNLVKRIPKKSHPTESFTTFQHRVPSQNLTEINQHPSFSGASSPISFKPVTDLGS